ncbi:branched-chain amino acid ABC transporter permease [Sulfitobacter sp. F26204]|uniref:branched-chain amino acid ABC transporter permease n=1 Tax=Sulfitobacter sp. F26204 TaxID=2996014 RepID=UPI00225E5971|nr:branched-chain amino acid ABC transporter permease [Sulfitobacter sp. F26204]MCX7557944.1 branched-chain amino acid ABC transporter permease [Sulfitobacter sp. F26204]
MFYREAGDFRTTYAEDQQTFPIKFDRYRYYVVLFIAIFVIPFIINDYWANSLLLPFLIYAIAALGLNILVGYCGQVSLGTGGFMAVGAYSCYKFMTGVDIWWGGELLFRLPEFNIFFSVIMGGVMTAAVGVLFGLPSLRIKGFYLAVATLAAQFFLVWLFNRVAWFYNYSASGQISAPEREFMGALITGPSTTPWATYLFCLFFTIVSAVIARNMTRGASGRKWMAIRDMDIAAEIIGVNPLKAKLTAFMVSSFFIGISGALFFAVYLGAVEVGEAFGITKSFLVLFMIIIGGLGSIFGSFAGAAFLVLLPVALKVVGVDWFGWPTDIVAHLQLVVVGGLIVIFLIAEPHGIAQLWRVAKEKLRLWPFPH